LKFNVLPHIKTSKYLSYTVKSKYRKWSTTDITLSCLSTSAENWLLAIKTTQLFNLILNKLLVTYSILPSHSSDEWIHHHCFHSCFQGFNKWSRSRLHNTKIFAISVGTGVTILITVAAVWINHNLFFDIKNSDNGQARFEGMQTVLQIKASKILEPQIFFL
jgi:hypothetical protein